MRPTSPNPVRAALAGLAALLCAGFAGCPDENKPPPNVLAHTHQLIRNRLSVETLDEWDVWIGKLTKSAEVDVDSRIALGQLFLHLYHRQQLVEEHGPHKQSLRDYTVNRLDPSGRLLLAEACWYLASVVSESVYPADRQTAVQWLIKVLDEKNRSITSSVADGIPVEHQKPRSEIKELFLRMGLTHLQIVFLADRLISTRAPGDLTRLRQALEDHADWMDAIARFAGPNREFRAYFSTRGRDERAMVGLDADDLLKVLEQEPWKAKIFTRLSLSGHRDRAEDAKTQVMTLRQQGADRIQIYEQMENTLLHILYVVEASCIVHRGADRHAKSVSDAALEEARGALDWILGVAESEITRPTE